MKATLWISRGSHLSDSKTSVRHSHRPLCPAALAAVFGALILWATGCASDPAGKVSVSAPPGLPIQERLNLGTIGIAPDTTPAATGFASGVGLLETRGERTARLAGDTINASSGEPGADALLSVGTFAATPFIALWSTVARSGKMNYGQMISAQLDVTAALDRISRQDQFQAEVIRAAREAGGRELVTVGQARGDPSRVNTLLKTRIDQVSLEQAGTGNDLFFLRIKTSNRLIRASDGKTLHERPMEFCSGTALYIDWTRASAIDSVMQTGMRQLAQNLASEVLSVYDTPILAGAAKPAVRSRSAPPLAPVKLAGLARHSKPGLIQVADTGSAAFGLFATSQVARVSVQNVDEIDPETPVSVQQTEWMLDGMDRHPNAVVSLLAIAVATPISTSKQVVEIFMRLSPEKLRSSKESLDRAARAPRLEEQVALEVAENLAPQTDQPLALVNGPLPPPGVSTDLESTPHSPRVQFVSRRGPASRLSDTALQIRITSAALTGDGEFNPRLSLCVQGEADLVRLSDGVKLCSFPMEYRSGLRRYTQWAANDAALFRQELKRGHRELGKALADHLVARGIVPPGRPQTPFLAGP
jgi:hypothetical protein